MSIASTSATLTPDPKDNPGIEDELSYVRLCRVMRSDNADKDPKWRAMYERGGTQWMTLYARDIALLANCKAGDKSGYEAKELIYKPDEQPLVSIRENDGIYSLYSVYYGNRYVNHEEGEKLMTENKPVAKKDLSIEDVDATIQKAFDARKEALKKERPSDSTVFTEEDEKRENAQALLDVSHHLDGQLDRIGKVQLRTLWKLRDSGDFRALPDSPQGITAIVRNEQYENRDYMLSLAMVVDRVFPQVKALSDAGSPFTNPTTGEPITVEGLIMSEGLIGKLTKSSALFEKLVDLDKRKLLMGAIVTKTRDEVAALRDQLSKAIVVSQNGSETEGEDGDEAQEKSSLIPVLVEAIPSSKAGTPGKHRLILDDLDDAQMRAVLTMLKPLVGDVKQ